MRRRDEHGAFAVLAVLVLVVCMTVAAFAVDIAMSRIAARDMQAVSDLAALDAARELPSCDRTRLTAAARSAADRQTQAIGTRATPVVVGGVLDPTTGTFTERPSSASGCTAVKVTAATTVGYTFTSVVGGPSSDTQERSAVATNADPAVCFAVGARGLALDSSRSALGPLLDHLLRVELGVADDAGLIGVKGLAVPLLDLAAELGVGTPQELAALPALALRDLFLASAEVLGQDGHVVEAGVLRAVGLQLGTLTLNVADILAVATGAGSALGAELDVFDLITAAVLAAHQGHAVDIPALGVSLPANLVDATARVTIIEPPRIACGGPGTSARSAQIRVDLAGDVNAVDLAAVRLNLGVHVADATATLRELRCEAVPEVTLDVLTGLVQVQRSGLLPADPTAQVLLTTSQFLRVLGPLGDGLGLLLNLVGIGHVSLDVSLGATVAPGAQSATFAFPEGALPGPVVVGPGGTLRLNDPGVSLSANQNSLLGVIGGLVDPVLAALLTGLVVPLVDSTLDPLLSAVLLPTLDALGIQIGLADVEMVSAPDCSGVRLVQ
ncbi:hypothetical protein D9V41_05475 [Aeromicrobium phragmitis]|uniref:Flp pilus-assembly TadG-like N-terminal domain-containing protein n=1 Tax=Aeromicrobium phragmitis TaxID=2478914 RepID=A0A3L8PMA7_9ACTN|nr:hypothetical protein [Aeromicrobium phragmitis]RLV56526.1 hypothetical protein D9V41_05475 [Aeromicrobium phragmitis]